ncbi:MAG: hypothetical protein ACHQVS_01270 [Candidatus Babeliales bacterium]
MLKHLIMCSTFLLTNYLQAVEVKRKEVKPVGPLKTTWRVTLCPSDKAVSFDGLIKPYRDEITTRFGQQKADELCVVASLNVTSVKDATNTERIAELPGLPSAAMWVPLSIIEKNIASGFFKYNEDEFCIPTPRETINAIRKSYAAKPRIEPKVPKTQQDPTPEELEELKKKCNGDPQLYHISLMLLQKDKEAGEDSCIIM